MSRMDFDPSFFNRTVTIAGGETIGGQGGVSPDSAPFGQYAVCIQRSANRSNIDRQDEPLAYGQGGATLRRAMVFWGVYFQVDPGLSAGARLTADDGRKFCALGPAADGGDGLFNLWLVECEQVD